MTPPRLVEAADELLRFLDANGRSACLIGGIVVSRWGEPRATKDVDATVLVDFRHEAAVLEVLQRASNWQVTPDIALRTCSAEDLVLYKLVAARLIDLHDVQSVVSRMGARLDADRVRLWGGRFAEILEKPELLEPFEAALRKPGRLP